MNAISKASAEELANIDGLGDTIAQSITDWFDVDWHKSIVKKWESAGVVMVAQAAAQLPQTLAGLTFVVTGGLESFTRDGIAENHCRTWRKSIVIGFKENGLCISRKRSWFEVSKSTGARRARY
jgi:NAD-dependent DNA ligase